MQAQIGERHLPAKNWIYSFLEWHLELDLKRPIGLVPKHAQNFNPTIVKCHFQLLGDFLNAHVIAWKNIYNINEKGIQLGGGQKLNYTRYLYSREQHNCIKLKSLNLELVKTIKCVSAEQLILKLGIVFCGKHVLHDGYFEEDGIL
jgi:hypothetical protein